MKKILSGIIVCLFAWVLVITNCYAKTYSQEFLHDKNKILSEDVATTVQNNLSQMEKDYDFGVYIYLVKSTSDKNANAADIAEILLAKTGKTDGALLYLDTQTRRWAYVTQGKGETYFCDECRRWIMKDVLDELSDDNYDKAITIFVDESKMFLDQAKTGKPYTADNLPSRPVPLMWVGADIVLGAVVGFLIAHHKKSALTSVGFTEGAKEYLVEDSFQLLDQKDIFVDKKTTTRRIERPSESVQSDSSTTQGKF